MWDFCNWWSIKICKRNAHSVLQFVTRRHMGGKVQNQMLWKLGHLVLRVHNLWNWVDLSFLVLWNKKVDALRAAHLHRGLATSCLAVATALALEPVYSASLRHHVPARTAQMAHTGPDVSSGRDRGSAIHQFMTDIFSRGENFTMFRN